MKIVVTDGYVENPGDLSWDQIAALGDLVVYDRTTAEEISERCKDADVVLTNKVPFSKETLAKLPKLKLISMLATGYNVIDIIAAKQQGVTVCNAPAYGTASVAQHAFALILELTNHVGKNSAATSAGRWHKAIDWCFTEGPIMELQDKTFGVVGFGNIGQRAASIAHAFGMEVIYANRSSKPVEYAKQVDIPTVFQQSDIVSLHCPLTADNTQFVNRALLQTMKPTAFLINTARGQLINEQDLANALNEGVIAGAGLDVLSVEPPLAGNPLFEAKNCIITPHNAWISKEARQRIMDINTENIKAFVNGNPINVVNS